MPTTVQFEQPCGCRYEIEVSHDWVDDVEEVESLDCLVYCNLHTPIYELVKSSVVIWAEKTRGVYSLVINRIRDYDPLIDH